MLRTPQKEGVSTRRTAKIHKDNEGFQLVTNRRKTKSTCSESSTTATNSTTENDDYTFFIDNIPERSCTQKNIYNYAKIIYGPKVSVKTYRTSATIKTNTTNADQKINKLKNHLGPIKITTKPPKTRNTQHLPYNHPSFSCDMKNIDHDITDEEIKTALDTANLKITKFWRIISKARNTPTKLIRLITKCSKSLDILLTEGLNMFGTNYSCEPSKTPGPMPIQCGKCLDFGHQYQQCPSATKSCGSCSEPHENGECPTNIIKCINCDGSHHAWSTKCPKRPTVTKENEAAPLKIIDRPMEDASDDESEYEGERFLRIEDFIRFITQILLNTHPLQRSTIAELIQSTSKTLLKRKTAISYAGNSIHITVNKFV